MAVIILDAIAHFIEANMKKRVIACRVPARGAIANFIEKGSKSPLPKNSCGKFVKGRGWQAKGGDMAVKAQNHLYQSLKDPNSSLSN